MHVRPVRWTLSRLEDRVVPAGAVAEISLRSLLGSTPTTSTSTDVGVTLADLGNNRLAIGAAAGEPGIVRIVDRVTQRELARVVPYGEMFAGGVRVASGDVTGDGVADLVTTPGAGGGPHVRVFDGKTFQPVADFFAYDPAFRGGVTVAAGDTNTDGVADIVTGAGAGGGPHVRVFDGRTQKVVNETFAFDPQFTGGVNVAAGDVSGDGRADVVVAAGAGGGPRVRVYSGKDFFQLGDFFAYDPSWRGGVNVAVGEVNGQPVIATGTDRGGNATVNVFDARTGTAVRSLNVDAEYPTGVRVFIGNFAGDGGSELATVPASGSPVPVRVYGKDFAAVARLDEVIAS